MQGHAMASTINIFSEKNETTDYDSTTTRDIMEPTTMSSIVDDNTTFRIFPVQEDLTKLALRSTFLIIITLLSCVGNLFVCITLYWRPYLLTPSNKLVFSLSTSNFIFSVLVMPFVIISSIAEEWLFGTAWCSITGFVTLLVMGASMFTLGAIAFDRYYAIVHPMFYPMIVTGFRTSVLIAFSWIFSGICALPPLFGAWSHFTFSPSTGGGCMPAWNEEVGFSVFWFLLCFFIPYILMLMCYGCIFQVARTKTRHVHARSDLRKRSSVMEETEVTDSYNALERGDNSSATADDESSDDDKQSKNIPEIKVTDIDETMTGSEGDSGINLTTNGSTSICDVIEEVTEESSSDSSSETNSFNVQADTKLRNGSMPIIVPLSDSRKSSSSSTGSKSSNENSYFKDGEAPRRKSSNASIISQTSQVFRRTSLAFSSVKYYRNQIKAMCTLAFILGILLLTMGCYTIISLMEVSLSSRNRYIIMVMDARSKLKSISPTISSTSLSVATCLMFLTCVYYPLIYGLWNRTVRKEMRCLFCGHQRHPYHEPLRKQRMLSLTTHIQDLGMSPGLTAAIIGEDPVAFKAAVIQDNIARDNNLRLSSRWSKPDKERMMAGIEKRRHTLPVLSMFGTGDPDSETGGVKKMQRRFSRFAMNFGAISEEEHESAKSKLAELKMQRHLEKAEAQSIADKTYINTIANGGSYKMMLKNKDYPKINNNSPMTMHRRESIVNEAMFDEGTFNDPLNPSLLYPGYKTHKTRRSSLFNLKTPFLQLSPMSNKRNKIALNKKRTSSLAQIEPPAYLLKQANSNLQEDEEEEEPEKPIIIPKRSNSKRTSVHFNISVLERDTSSLGGIIEEEEEEGEFSDDSSQVEEESSLACEEKEKRKVNFEIKPDKDEKYDLHIHSSKFLQPINLSKWTPEHYMAYIASTSAYNIINEAKCKVVDV